MQQYIKKFWQKLRFTRSKQQVFLEDLCSLIEDGLTINQALDTIQKVTEGITKIIAADINTALTQGLSFADGLNEWFHPAIVEVLRAGERGGSLINALHSAIHSFSIQSNALRLLINSLIYPICVLSVAFIVMVFIKISVLDTFTKIKPITQWPPAGQTLYQLSLLIQQSWWLLLFFIGLLIFAITKLLKQYTGSFREIIDKTPVLSLYRKMAAARFMETLGLLVSNGVILKQALLSMYNEASPYLSWHLTQMQFRLSYGQENIADIFDTHLIDHGDLTRLRVIANGKGLEHALMSLGRQANQKIEKTLGFVGKVSGGILLAITATFAMIIVFGIYSVGASLTG